jgi:hypothetical protein
VVDISRTEYELCDMDILYADGITPSDGLASTDISFPQLALDVRVVDEPDTQDTMLRLILSQKAAVIRYLLMLRVVFQFHCFNTIT